MSRSRCPPRTSTSDFQRLRPLRRRSAKGRARRARSVSPGPWALTIGCARHIQIGSCQFVGRLVFSSGAGRPDKLPRAGAGVVAAAPRSLSLLNYRCNGWVCGRAAMRASISEDEGQSRQRRRQRRERQRRPGIGKKVALRNENVAWREARPPVAILSLSSPFPSSRVALNSACTSWRASITMSGSIRIASGSAAARAKAQQSNPERRAIQAPADARTSARRAPERAHLRSSESSRCRQKTVVVTRRYAITAKSNVN